MSEIIEFITPWTIFILTCITGVYIGYSAKYTNYAFMRKQLIKLAITSSLLFILTIVSFYFSPVLLPIIFICTLFLPVIAWNREHQVIDPQTKSSVNKMVKQYQFVFPRGIYKELEYFQSFNDCISFARSGGQIIEIHESTELGPPKKHCIILPSSENIADQLQKDDSQKQYCIHCDDMSHEYFPIFSVWNNPNTHKIKERSICQQCFINNLQFAESELDTFEAPTGELLATKL